MRIRLLGWAVVGVVGLAACGGGSRVANPAGWSKQVRINFITSCTLTTGGQTTRCGCMADKLSKEIPAQQADSLAPDDPRFQAALKSC